MRVINLETWFSIADYYVSPELPPTMESHGLGQWENPKTVTSVITEVQRDFYAATTAATVVTLRSYHPALQKDTYNTCPAKL